MLEDAIIKNRFFKADNLSCASILVISIATMSAHIFCSDSRLWRYFDDQRQALEEGIMSNDIAQMSHVLDSRLIDINRCCIANGLPLELAVEMDENNTGETTGVLLGYGAEPNCGSVYPVLHYAIRCGRSKAVEALLEYGANVHVQDRNWNSSLMVLLKSECSDDLRLIIFEHLKKYGASVLEKYFSREVNVRWQEGKVSKEFKQAVDDAAVEESLFVLHNLSLC